MNPSWNERLTEEELHERCMVRGRRVLSQIQRVLTLTYERQTVSAIATALSIPRERVRYLQHVLELRNGRGSEDDEGLGKYPRPSADSHGSLHALKLNGVKRGEG